MLGELCIEKHREASRPPKLRAVDSNVWLIVTCHMSHSTPHLRCSSLLICSKDCYANATLLPANRPALLLCFGRLGPDRIQGIFNHFSQWPLRWPYGSGADRDIVNNWEMLCGQTLSTDAGYNVVGSTRHNRIPFYPILYWFNDYCDLMANPVLVS